MVSYLYHCATPRIMMKFASIPVVLSESSDHACDSRFRKPMMEVKMDSRACHKII